MNYSCFFLYIVLNNIFYPVQERDHHSRGVLSAGGEGVLESEQTNPLVNQFENLDVEFNSLEDMVSIVYLTEMNSSSSGVIDRNVQIFSLEA